jgi:hypothetical protein
MVSEGRAVKVSSVIVGSVSVETASASCAENELRETVRSIEDVQAACSNLIGAIYGDVTDLSNDWREDDVPTDQGALTEWLLEHKDVDAHILRIRYLILDLLMLGEKCVEYKQLVNGVSARLINDIERSWDTDDIERRLRVLLTPSIR